MADISNVSVLYSVGAGNQDFTPITDWNKAVLYLASGYTRSYLNISLDSQSSYNWNGVVNLRMIVEQVNPNENGNPQDETFVFDFQAAELTAQRVNDEFEVVLKCKRSINETVGLQWLKRTAALQARRLINAYGADANLSVSDVLDHPIEVDGMYQSPTENHFSSFSYPRKEKLLLRVATAVAQGAIGVAVDGINHPQIDLDSFENWEGSGYGYLDIGNLGLGAEYKAFPFGDFPLRFYAEIVVQSFVNEAKTLKEAIDNLARIGLSVEFQRLQDVAELYSSHPYRLSQGVVEGYRSESGYPWTSVKQVNSIDENGEAVNVDIYTGVSRQYMESLEGQYLPEITDPTSVGWNLTRENTPVIPPVFSEGVTRTDITSAVEPWDVFVGTTRVKSERTEFVDGKRKDIRSVVDGVSPPWGYMPDKVLPGVRGINFSRTFNQWVDREVHIIGVQALARTELHALKLGLEEPDLNVQVGNVYLRGRDIVLVKSSGITFFGEGELDHSIDVVILNPEGAETGLGNRDVPQVEGGEN